MSITLEAPPLVMELSGPPVTPDELLHMADGDRYELVDGELVEKVLGALSGWVGNRIGAELDQYARHHGGWAFGDGVGYRCYADDFDRVRKPDASFIRVDRMAMPPEGFITVVPDLVVEVVSPSDVYYEVEAKVDEYLHAGVRLVWVINPPNMTVRIFQQRADVRQLGPADELTGGDVLPGFTCGVRSLFPVSPPAAQ